MRKLVKSFLEICIKSLPLAEPIVEIGSFQVERQVGFADLRPYFPGKKYIGVDLRSGPGVDLVLDAHNLSLKTESASTVLIFDTLEHVAHPYQVIREARRILRRSGYLLISSVMNFEIHEHPFDYWRFTPQGFSLLLDPFIQKFVGFAGKEKHPHTVVGIAVKGEKFPSMRLFVKRYRRWQTQFWKRQIKKIPIRKPFRIKRS